MIFKPLDNQSSEMLLFLPQEPKWVSSPFHLIRPLCKPVVRYCTKYIFVVLLSTAPHLSTHMIWNTRARAHAQTLHQMVKAVPSELHGRSSGREFLPCHLHPQRCPQKLVLGALSEPVQSKHHLLIIQSLTKRLAHYSYVTLHRTFSKTT